MHDSHRQASRQWIDELTSAGFTIDTATVTSTEPRRCAVFAQNVQRVSEPLGAELADSYLAHVELLDHATHEGSTRRFEIIAKL
ncbi:MAG: hypothetical protein ACRDR6_14860 [Pseudonocardiaceae bacterium]